MMFLVTAIQLVARLLVLLVIVDVILSYFMSPYHQIRITLDRIVEPMLTPIRRVVPSPGGLDLSPIILILIIQLVEYLVVTLLLGAG